MWAHYANKHTGVCLAFEVNNKDLIKVKYSKKLLSFNEGNLLNLKSAEKIVSIKSHKWHYEKEYRMFTKYGSFEPIGDIYFEPFSEDLKLIEVILGYKCNKEIIKEMTEYPVFKVDLSIKNFQVTKTIL